MIRVAVPAVAVALLAAGCAALPAESAAPASPRSSGVEQLARLQIATEDTGAPYDRDDWPHWSTVQGACDTRETQLRDQGQNVRIDPKTCRVLSGTWVSRYDGVTVTAAKDVDLDHMVPLAEVQRSGRVADGRRVGSRQWGEVERERYANDPAVLVAVTAKSNRQKSDQDPARWLPDLDRCGYVQRWVQVKATYSLSVDQAEHDAIAAVLRRC